MNQVELHEEFLMLEEYMSVYIQLLPYSTICNGLRLHKPQLPTFEYFKETFCDKKKSMYVGSFKESKTIYKDRIITNHTHGLGTECFAERRYNYWMGCKYYTGGNIKGDWHYNLESNLI